MTASDGLPAGAFLDPTGANRSDAAELLERALRLVLEHAARAAERPPLPDSGFRPPEPLLSEAPVPSDRLFDLLRAALEGSMNPGHPGYIGHMDSIPTTMSLVGELAAAAANNNLLSVEMSPVFSRLEGAMTRAFARLFGLGERSGGVLTSGGTLANLHALAAARNARLGTGEAGLVGIGRPPVILASEAAHTSLRKAAMLLGLGADAVIPVPTDRRDRLRPDALERAIAAAREDGRAPFAVVGTAGTTVTGSVDPLSEIGEVARGQGLWFHVDAAYGGAVAVSPRERHRLAGIGLADSVTFNPQKWLYVAKTCAMVLARDWPAMRRLMRVAAPYMAPLPEDEDDAVNLGEVGIQGTRHAEILKLWLSVQHLGLDGYARLIDHALRLAELFAREVRARPYLRLAVEPDLNLVCFRGEPPTLRADAWDGWNARLQAHLGRRGVFLSLPLYRGGRWLRAVLLNPYTSPAQVAACFAEIDRHAAAEGDGR